MKMAFSYMFPSFDDKDNQADLTVFIPINITDAIPTSKEIQKQKWLEIIENLQSRLLSNDHKMTEIGKKLMKMKGSPKEEKNPFPR